MSYNLLNALNDAKDEQDFDAILYAAIRSDAFEICTPKELATIDDSDYNSGVPGSATSNETTYQHEFDSLQKSIFNVFDNYIAGTTGCAGEEVLTELERKLCQAAPGSSTICGHIFKSNEPTYSCSDCALDPTCVLCSQCFCQSLHINHNYKMQTSNGGGYCDCGDVEAWHSDPWCQKHRPATEGEASPNSGDELIVEESEPCSAVEQEIRQEVEAMRHRISKLPTDVVKRVGRLLKPLINSSIVCLMDGIQNTTSLTVTPISQPANSDEAGVSSDSSSKAAHHQTVGRGSVQLMDVDEEHCAEVDTWPPPVNHVPSSTRVADSNRLGRDLPRTAPLMRSASAVETRCLLQLSRLRRLHGQLFRPERTPTARPPRTSTASSSSPVRLSSVSQPGYAVIVYNNEVHTYPAVIKSLARALSVPVNEATAYTFAINRDGRSVVMLNLPLKRACWFAENVMHFSEKQGTLPICCTVEHMDVCCMSVFFTLTLRWLSRLSDLVPSLRPVLCHALLGDFPPAWREPDGRPLLSVARPEEIMPPGAWLSAAIQRHCLTWKVVRSEIQRCVIRIMLCDSFYRRVFAIHYARAYDYIVQSFIYDDHLEADSFFSMSTQIFTVTSLARQLLEQHQILTRLFTRLERAFCINSIALPSFYSPPTPSHTGRSQASVEPETGIAVKIARLRQLNPFEWGGGGGGQTSNSSALSDGVPPEPRVLVWSQDTAMSHSSTFNAFERMFTVLRDTVYILGSLTNVKPVEGDADQPQGWWTPAGRAEFIEYACLFLSLLTYVQDINAIQRETQVHVEQNFDWSTSAFIVVHLLNTLNMTVQVASTDTQLYTYVLQAARQAFERRVGIMDRRFRVPALSDDVVMAEPDEQSRRGREVKTSLEFCALGCTTEVYDYDVSVYSFSVMQPLPRFLASLYGHGLEMGLTFEQLGLKDKAFVNLLIERPLQVLAFCAQVDAKLWVRNGTGVQQWMLSMFEPSFRAELIDRDFQLLQLGAAILPPDEFLVRMIHKLNLGVYLTDDAKDEGSPGRVRSVEMLLRCLLNIVTQRSRPGVATFSEEYIEHLQSLEQEGTVPPGTASALRECTVDPGLEFGYPGLVDDFIHILAIRSLSFSELIRYLPYQPSNCLRLSSASSTSVQRRKAAMSLRANRQSLEQVLPDLLHRLTTRSSVGGRTMFSLKPEVMAYRFNRFFWGYGHAERTTAESNLDRHLKKWTENMGSSLRAALPIPPPAPPPFRSFTNAFLGEGGPIRLLHCPTFVRMLRAILQIVLVHATGSRWWSDTALDLVLHLIHAALYEDELEGRRSGSYPFLEVVARVPVDIEDPALLRKMACSHRWLDCLGEGNYQIQESNCLTVRLNRILQSHRHEDHSVLIRWTLNLWQRVLRQRERALSVLPTSGFGEQTAMEAAPVSTPIPRSVRADEINARKMRIMAKMSRMQKSFLKAHACETSLDSKADESGLSQLLPANGQSRTRQHVALGPHRSLSGLNSMLFPGANAAPAERSTTVTCCLCLEEVAEHPDCAMVFSARVCRSSALSSGNSSWLEGPATVAVLQRLSGAAGGNRSADADQPLSNAQNMMSSETVASCTAFLASAATSVVAAAAEQDTATSTTIANKLFAGFQGRSGKKPKLSDDADDESLCYTRSAAQGGTANNREAQSLEESVSGHSEVDVGDMICLFPLPGSEGTSPSRLLDTWCPRPLVASRDPIAEEGSFLSVCSHPMHAACKAKYARQLKSRMDGLNRAQRLYNAQTVFEFKCPICTSVANLDLPVLGPVYLRLPAPWLVVRLMPDSSSSAACVDEETASDACQKFAIGPWLSTIVSWLEAPTSGGGVTQALSSNLVTLSQFWAHISKLSRGPVSDEDAAASPEQTSPGAGSPSALVSLLESVLTRLSNVFGDVSFSSTTTTSSASDDAVRPHSSVDRVLSGGPTDRLRVLIRWGRSIAARRSGPSDEDSTQASFSSSSALAPAGTAAHQLLVPPPSPPDVITCLLDVVQRLYRLSKPQSLGALMQTRARAGAGERGNSGLRGVDAQHQPLEERPMDLSNIAADREISGPGSGSWHSLFFTDEIDLFLSSLRMLSHQLAKLLAVLNQTPVASDEASVNGGRRELLAAVHAVNCNLAYVERQARATVLSAAREWRALRHSTAYTLVALEKSIRETDAPQQFFEGALAERQLNGLRSVLQTSLAAHAQFATVSRGCMGDTPHHNATTCPVEAEQVRSLLDHPNCWWWWAYCAPETVAALSSAEHGGPDACRLTRSPQLIHLAVTASQIAATEDARRLWHLLIPQLDSDKFESPMVVTGGSGEPQDAEETEKPLHEDLHPFAGRQPISLLWEVDLVFLFVSLLHLRPGLEERVIGVPCQCQRQPNDNKKKGEQEAVEEEEGQNHFLACDQGRPREPIGDAHETHLVRLCYTAVLCQALLSWQPDPQHSGEDADRTRSLFGLRPVDNDDGEAGWSSPLLLRVWDRLRSLSGLPNLGNLSPTSGQEEVLKLASSLGQHLRMNSLPFLRIAALVMHIITGVEVPPASGVRGVDEHALLLTYLGLPTTPSDLLMILSSQRDLEATGIAGSRSDSPTAALSESLWMARLVTSWCLAGRRAASRSLFAHLCRRFLTPASRVDGSLSVLLLPEPDVRLPRLIRLPREYAHLLSLTVDFKCFIGENAHSDPSICLVCGHFAYYVCCGCRQCKPVSTGSYGSEAAAETLPADCMQAHCRRYHAGYSLILCIFACRVMMLSDQARRSTQMSTPYRDAFGEADHDLRRGNPLFLVPAEYEHLNRLWLSHQSMTGALSDLVISPTV